jgi:hypothetical protein
MSYVGIASFLAMTRGVCEIKLYPQNLLQLRITRFTYRYFSA